MGARGSAKRGRSRDYVDAQPPELDIVDGIEMFPQLEAFASTSRAPGVSARSRVRQSASRKQYRDDRSVL